MNAVEIEEAISLLAEQAFDQAEFPFAFLEAFGNKATTIKRLRVGTSNKSDIDGVLQTSNIHIKTCEAGHVTASLDALRDSPATKKAKAKFILATDGIDFQAEDLVGGGIVACAYKEFPNEFGFFLPLAGISTVQQIRESAFDIKATGRLNRLYIELLEQNPDWGTAERRHDMNHFMARLIFCFFAEDTEIFDKADIFTNTIETMSAADGSNMAEIISTLFDAMNIKAEDKPSSDLPRWAKDLPYVNGGLFSGSTEVPNFTKIARSYLVQIGRLDWKKINPDIFGSMIQAVADDDERGALGMHYTSVPNILKVLNPLFLDDLNAVLEQAGDNSRKLLNLRNRMAKIRVFDPACGSGNFLVIAYKKMRAIEAEINNRRGEATRKSDIPLTNFRGIEIKSFPAEIARLALIIAEYQCDVEYRGQKEALKDVLPLGKENWITCGNALRLDWLKFMDVDSSGVKLKADDLFGTDLEQPEIDFENEGGETYICGNPPYVGRKYQSNEQKEDLKAVFRGRTKDTLSLDYVSGWFIKAADFLKNTRSFSAFVTTNSISQGIQVSALWPVIFDNGVHISFAIPSFKWANLASKNAGVTVSVIGLTLSKGFRKIFEIHPDGNLIERSVENINAYLTAGENVSVVPVNKAPPDRAVMQFGNHPYYANALILSPAESRSLISENTYAANYIKPLFGSKEFISATPRYCLWIKKDDLSRAKEISEIRRRIELVRKARAEKTKDAQAQKLVNFPYKFRDQYSAQNSLLVVPIVTSENREYLPVGTAPSNSIIHNKAFALYDAPLWNMALIASRLHWVWIGTVCVRLEMRFSYSNTLGWNTFPVPTLTQKNKDDLTRCAENILLAREAHFPATIADLYDPEKMPENLRAAHDRNDEVLERIYMGRRFKNDTERLEKLFDLYTKMTNKVEGEAA